MKNHIRITYILIVAALSAFLLLACPTPFQPPPDQQGTAAWEGTFTLNIGGGNAGRTILPTAVQSNFAIYTLVFSSAGKGNVTADRTNANLSSHVTLPAGTWDLTVTAYMDGGKPAARGSITGIEITAGANVSRSLELKPIIENGAKGTFSWNINFPADVTVASIKITPLDASGTPEQTYYFIGGTPSAYMYPPLSLNTGYYQVVFSLSNGAHTTGREEYLHIYQNMDSRFEYTFTQDHFTVYSVTNNADSGPGSLRHAITNAASDSTILIENGVGTILLRSQLSIRRSLTIVGNGVTITRDPSTSPKLLEISGGTSSTVTINRVHFKDGKADYGAAISVFSGSVNLESCIFSGNQSTGSGGSVYIMSSSSSGNIKGCTFYGNSSGTYGGAIFNGGSLTLTGNLFYGNTAASTGRAVSSLGTVTSNGYNVVDVPLGTGSSQSGWAGHSTDKTVSSLPLLPVNFKPFSGGGAQNVITSRPTGYPTADFYGDPIPASGAAAGAVQSVVSGYFLTLSVNNSEWGSVSASPQPNSDGLYSGTVTLTAAPKAPNELAYWLVDGNKSGSDNPFNFTLTKHSSVQAVFTQVEQVNKASVIKVTFAGPTKTVNINGLSNNEIYLVKVNTTGSQVSATNTGKAQSLSPTIVNNDMPISFNNTNTIPRMGHPAADEFHANPPPITKKRAGSADRSIASLAAYVVGNTTQFWVETSLNNRIWVQKTATLRAQGTFGNIWVMNDLTSFTSAQAEAMAAKFDQIYPIETSLLGYEYGGGPTGDGGKDGDKRIQILVYDIGISLASTTLGYYWAKDYYDQSYLDVNGYNLKTNMAEMFYLNGNSAVVTIFGDQLYSTLVHEFQHMINFSQKTIKNGVNSGSWYNEMLSMLAEDVISPLIGIAPTNSGHPIKSRIPTFLTNYHLSGTAEWEPTNNALDSYSVMYAFGAYLIRNYGGADLLKEMLANNTTNINSVTAALKTVTGSGSFEDALRRFGEAMVFSGTMPSDVLSFDKTVTKTIGGNTYTATKFNVWSDFGTTKPKIFGSNEQVSTRPYSITVHQDSAAWKNKSGTFSITLEKPASSSIEFYLMVK
jgi:hypothetical protein